MKRFDELPKIAELAKPATMSKITHGPRIAKIEKSPDNPDLMVSDTPTTQDEFNARFDKWGRGTKSEFAVYDYLTTRLKMIEARDFYFVPSGIRGDLTTFYVSSTAMRITNDVQVESKAQKLFNRGKLEQNGYKVVDLQAQNLQFGLIEATVNAALRGQEL